ncbi:MAG: hypothetical protein ACE5D7_04010 [Fidelibacterota bacterium]
MAWSKFEIHHWGFDIHSGVRIENPAHFVAHPSWMRFSFDQITGLKLRGCLGHSFINR